MKVSRPPLVKAAGALVAAGLVSSFFALRISAGAEEKPFQSRIMPVLATTVEIDDSFEAKRSFTGRAVPGRISNIAFELGGTVKSVHVDLGDTVEAGAVLADLDTSRLIARRAELRAEADEVEASLDLAERTLKRTRETFAGGHVSAQKLDETEANAISLRARQKRLAASIEALEVDISKAHVTAPFTGVITRRFLDEGTVVAGGTPVVELSENTHMEAHIGMPPEQAQAVEAGAKIEIRNGRREPIEGARLRSLVPVIEGQTRTMMVTFDLPDGSVSRGELVTAVVRDRQSARGTWLPMRALSSDVRGLWRVYKVVGEGDARHVQFENVQILYTDVDRVYVTGTIAAGDRVVADGIERLAPGQRVSILDRPADGKADTSLADAQH